MQNGFNTYQKINTMGMSQLDLILTVYRGAIDQLERSKSAFQENNFTAGRSACEKARKFIVHLYTTLDMEKGEEIADQLSKLYAFMIQQIDLAIANKSQELLNEVIGLLSTVMEGWKSLKADEAKSLKMDKLNQINDANETESKSSAELEDVSSDNRLIVSA